MEERDRQLAVDEVHDVIVVGSGASGGTLAARLSESGSRDVLLVEAGRDFPDEATSPPAFLSGGALTGYRGVGSGPPSPEYDWGYRSEPLDNGRRIPLTRGRLVGGTTMTNGSVAVRGKPSDFDRWVQAGGDSWGWEAMVGAYESAERELSVHAYPPERWLPVQHLLVNACQDVGYRYEEKLNAPDAWDRVTGPWPRSRRDEIRLGSLNTYIRAARSRPNFRVLDRTAVDRILFEGNRAVGVQAIGVEGPYELRARKVVLSAGAYGSAPILLRSGVGPKADLDQLGVASLVDLPVGEHLMEHPALSVFAAVQPQYAQMGWPALAAVARGEGFWCIPMPCSETESLVMFNLCLATVDGPVGGRISIESDDPLAPPAIHVGFQSVIDTGGFDRTWEGLREILGSRTALAAQVRDAEGTRPLKERLEERMGVGFHAAGGCDLGLVVDSDLAVLGTEGLHVADASIFPAHVTNNPMLTCFAVGELAAAKLGD